MLSICILLADPPEGCVTGELKAFTIRHDIPVKGDSSTGQSPEAWLGTAKPIIRPTAKDKIKNIFFTNVPFCTWDKVITKAETCLNHGFTVMQSLITLRCQSKWSKMRKYCLRSSVDRARAF
jgi:hypothetical protein